MKVDTNKFWQFSIELYRNSDVAEQLLSLQERYHANVNLCLFLIYLDKHQQQLEIAQLKTLQHDVEQFSATYTRPLRTLRHTFKYNLKNSEHYAALRSSMLEAELSLEKQEQQLLVTAFNDFQCAHQSSASNLVVYLELLLKLSKTDLDQIFTVLKKVAS